MHGTYVKRAGSPRRLTVGILVVVMAAGCICVVGANAADSRQKNKNMWRNAAIGSGAVAVYGLTHHKDTLTILGAAGAAYSAQRYEDDRHSQSKQSAARSRFHARVRPHHWIDERRHDRGLHRGHAYGHYKHHRDHDDDDD